MQALCGFAIDKNTVKCEFTMRRIKDIIRKKLYDRQNRCVFYGDNMDNILRKKRIRRIALIILAAAAVAAALFAADFERADYRQALGDTVKEAQSLLLEAETGYEKGQYLPDIVVAFSEDIDTAKAVYEDKSSVYEEQKAAYEALKESIGEFKKAANREDLTKKEIEKAKAEKDKSKSDKKSSKTSETNSGSRAGNCDKKSSSKDKAAEDEKITVSIQIRCDNLSNDMSKLTDEAKAPYVPSDGVILSRTKYRCEKGATVYDVLYAACRNHNIHIESNYTPVYGSYYIEGINHLYEFDAGSESGWMYRVNGAYPDYGCSSYRLADGDSIVWAYTCNLGKDLGHEYN